MPQRFPVRIENGKTYNNMGKCRPKDYPVYHGDHARIQTEDNKEVFCIVLQAHTGTGLFFCEHDGDRCWDYGR